MPHTLDHFQKVERLGLQTQKWSIVGYVNNLFDDDTLKSGVVNLPDFQNSLIVAGGTAPQGPGVPSGTVATLPDKRQFGVRANYKF